MAVHQLLLRGLLVGVLAGLVAFGVARLFGEPAVERGIAFESAEAKAHGHADEPELVSRAVQTNVGLPIGAALYGGAVGGLFSLVFAVAHGRLSRLSPKPLAVVLALLGFTATFAVPFLKYPANPPGAGEAATIALRTGLFVLMIVTSIVAVMAAFSLKQWVEPRLGAWNAGLAGVLVFVVLVSIAGGSLPAVEEVPAGFPATALWQFRIAAVGVQAALWSVLGIGFGLMVERSSRTQP